MNRYGVDTDYFKKWIARIGGMENHKPDELAREFARMSMAADSEVIREPEFMRFKCGAKGCDHRTKTKADECKRGQFAKEKKTVRNKRREKVVSLRVSGLTFKAIGGEMGFSANRARQLYLKGVNNELENDNI